MNHSKFLHPSRRRFMKGASALALGVTLLPFKKGWSAEEKKLFLYNWDTYIGENTVPTFQDATGVQVQIDFFGSNEELFGKLKAGNPGYDLIVPTDYTLSDMISLGMVVPLNHDKIPNMKNIDPNPLFSNPAYNPGLKYAVPYMWGTIGIGYRKSKVSVEDTNSWAMLLDSSEYKGRIALLDDARAVMGAALRYLGYSMNSKNEKEVFEARDLLIRQRPNIKTIAADNGQDLLASHDVDATFEYNGDIVQVTAEDDDVAYAFPKEGVQVWIDNMAIPKDAPHPENAHAFINHVLDAQVAADIANTIRYASPNAAARALINKEDLENPSIYPSETVLKNAESILSVGEFTTVYDQAWTQVRSA